MKRRLLLLRRACEEGGRGARALSGAMVAWRVRSGGGPVGGRSRGGRRMWLAACGVLSSPALPAFRCGLREVTLALALAHYQLESRKAQGALSNVRRAPSSRAMRPPMHCVRCALLCYINYSCNSGNSEIV